MNSRAIVAVLVLTTLFVTAPRGDGQHVAVPSDGMNDEALADLAAHGSESSALFFARDGRVRVLVLAKDNQWNALVSAIRALHGETEYTDSVLGYARLWIPSAHMATLADDPHVSAFRIDNERELFRWHEDEQDLVPRTVPRRPTPDPDASWTRVPPTLAPEDVRDPQLVGEHVQQALGLAQLRRVSPTFDGRGVTVAIVEDGAPRAMVTHPTLQHALDLDGRPIRKVRDSVIGIDPDWRRVREEAVLSSSEAITWHRGVAIRLPRPGTYQFGELNVERTRFGVLWNAASGDVWLDTDADANYSNDLPVVDLARSGNAVSTGRFKAPVAWPGGEYYVRIADDGRSVVVQPIQSRHGTMTASITAGGSSGSYLAADLAPAAAVVFVDTYVDTNGNRAHSYLEALIEAARRDDVDIVSVSTTAAKAMPSTVDALPGMLVDRIVERYGKPIVSSANNTYRFGGVDPDGRRAISVGAYIPSTMADLLFDISSPTRGLVWPYSERGPHANAAKPDVVGPAELVYPTRCGSEEPDAPYRVRLPPCHQLSSGTSASGPAVAGLLAALMSGAKQRDLRVPGTYWRDLLRASAIGLEGFGAEAQGAGVPQADRAWALLTSRFMPLDVECLSQLVDKGRTQTSHRADGSTGTLFNVRSSSSGSLTMQLTLTRRSGPATTVRYPVKLLANNGSFATIGSEISLPLNRPVQLSVAVTPKTSGPHSALLSLEDPHIGGSVFQHQLTVVVADGLHARTAPRVEYRQTIGAFGRGDHAFDVPQGARAVAVSYAVTGDAGVKIYDPRGWPVRQPNRVGFDGQYVKTGSYITVIDDPAPGTWTVVVGAGINNPIGTVAYEFAVELLYIERLETLSTQDCAPAVTANEQVRITSQSLKTRSQTLRATFRPGIRSATMPFVVSAGSQAFQLELAGLEGDARTQAFLYNCTSGTCFRRVARPHVARAHRVRIDNPTAGPWTLVLLRDHTTRDETFAGQFVEGHAEQRQGEGERWLFVDVPPTAQKGPADAFRNQVGVFVAPVVQNGEVPACPSGDTEGLLNGGTLTGKR